MPRVKLLINKEERPIGLKKEELRLSWLYPPEEAAFQQRAYRIFAASSPGALREDKALFYDSGICRSKENLNIPFTLNKAPSPERALYLRLLLCDEKGVWQDAGTSRFVMAPERFEAAWIWSKEKTGPNQITAFRRRFFLPEAPSEAYFYVSAHNHFELKLNGKRLGGFASPVPSHPGKNKLYTAYDAAPYLKQGENLLEADVLYLGGSGQNYVNGSPGFFLEGFVRTGNACIRIKSSEDWLCAGSTAYQNGMPFQQKRRISPVISYDARLTEEQIEWQKARAVPAPCPPEAFRRQMVPEGAAEYAIIPRLIRQEEGLAVFDAGSVISGRVRLQLREKAGRELRIRYSENLDENGRVGHNVANEKSAHYYDLYTAAGRGEECFAPPFTYKAFRYYEITGQEKRLRPEDAAAEVMHTALRERGSFFCSRPLLNRIFSACMQTQKNNALGQLTDCPHREQAQYLADADLQAESLLYFFDAAPMAEKVLGDFADAQFEDGTFPFVFPGNYEQEEFSLKIPEWDLHYGTLLEKLFFLTGDLRYLERYFPAFRAMLAHYLALRDPETGLPEKSQDWHISDWPYPETDHSGRFLSAQNIKIYKDLLLAAKMAERLGRNDEARRYWREAAAYKRALREVLFDPETRLFADSSGSSQKTTGINALALENGLFAAEEIPQVLRFLSTAPFTSSTLLSLNLLRVLFEYGRQDAAYALLNRPFGRGWGRMVSRGCTIWEGFEDRDSHSHAWNAYPARLFAEYLAGIRAAEAGFCRCEIKAFLPPGLDQIRCAVTTPQGIIETDWQKIAGRFQLDIKIPYGVTADVFYPLEKAGAYRFKSRLEAGAYRIIF